MENGQGLKHGITKTEHKTSQLLFLLWPSPLMEDERGRGVGSGGGEGEVSLEFN